MAVHDPRVCHKLDPMSYLQGQGHSAHMPKICVRAITPHCQVGSEYFTQLLSMTKGCVMTLTQGRSNSAHIPKIHVRAITPHCQIRSR